MKCIICGSITNTNECCSGICFLKAVEQEKGYNENRFRFIYRGNHDELVQH